MLVTSIVYFTYNVFNSPFPKACVMGSEIILYTHGHYLTRGYNRKMLLLLGCVVYQLQDNMTYCMVKERYDVFCPKNVGGYNNICIV